MTTSNNDIDVSADAATAVATAVPSSLQLLEDLVAFNTISADSNLALIAYVQQYLGRFGIESECVISEDGTKANLFAVVGPAHVPGIVLSGHTDVVPVKGQNWTGDPFLLRVRDGLAIGRGAVDMKGFLACALRCAALASAQPLKRPIIIALSHDEEIGCVGVRRLLPKLAEMPVRPLLCVIGEPTEMQVITAHKGKVMARVTCTGLEGHSSDPEKGVNAIVLAAKMIAAAEEVQQDMKRPESCDSDFTVPYSTLHIGVIAGGIGVNIIPRHCHLDFEIRTLPTADADTVLDQLRLRAEAIIAPFKGKANDVSIDIEVKNAYPALRTSDDDPAVIFTQRLCDVHTTGKVAFGTEGGLFKEILKVPAVVCGPGSVTQAHKPDEHISLSQLAACDVFLARLVASLCTDFTF